MSKLKTISIPLLEGKLRYCSPEVELHSLHTPLSLLTTTSESLLNLEGEVGNYDDGDEFY
ncbi:MULTISPECIES: hypothetical protein [unclassified Porphyromonas]|uniref:hypothetical protein n=1 Tax=unclassified Porphyromonas TaxID=2645799 RepID=UPI00126A1427|nr:MULTISPECIES: hypothetical protein [unclassified Porphyromonas]